MKRLCVVLLLSLQLYSIAQQTALDSVLSVVNRKNRFLPGPIFGYSSETSLSFGLTAYYTFFYDQKFLETRPSIAYGTSSYSLKKQFTNDIYLNAWTSENVCHFLIAWSFYQYTYYFYGIGNKTSVKDEQLLNQIRLEFSGNIERRIRKSFFYGGFEYDLKRDDYPSNDIDKLLFVTPTLHPAKGTFLRVGPSLVHDNRDNAYYTTKGHYYKINPTATVPGFAEEIKIKRLFVETRNFYTFKKIHTIGFNSNLQLQQGVVPFYELSQLGNASIMRGYYAGRYRDQNLFAAQVEYRWHFTPLLGVVFFAGAGTVFNSGLPDLGALKPTYGLGLRYFYDPNTGINLKIDYGLGQNLQGEPMMSNFYVGVGESF